MKNEDGFAGHLLSTPPERHSAFRDRVKSYVNPFPLPDGWEQEEWDTQCYISDVVLNWETPSPRQRDVIDVRPVKTYDERQGWIYFIGSDEGAIKIGFTANVDQRLRRLTASSPRPLRVLASKRGTMFDERAYHMRFARHRRHGEWFNCAPEILAEIERLSI